jgi:uncharacterized repeat protein (TIGR03806 family)
MTDATTRLAAALCLLAALLAGCDSGQGTSSTPAPPAPPAPPPPSPPPPPPPPGPTVGLDQRPSNTTCLAPARATGTLTIGVQQVFANLPAFTSPVAIMQAPANDTRWFVVEQGGVVRVFDNVANISVATTFININDGRLTSGGETGLLGMAFHPNFPTNPRVYLSYTAPGPLRSRISEFTTPDGGLTLNPASERILLTINQPESNHNGGGIAFGSDGFLYLGMGDGGGGNDQHGTVGNAQLLTTLLGKMIRIDISAGANGMLYRIPADNPFAANAPCGTNGTGTANCPEIYAWGLRNPWRWSFDRQTGALWVGDVGQNAIEEVSRVVRGGNYGWRCFEGTRNTGLACGPNANPQPPVAEYGRSVGVTVTGGYVYRGQDFPGLVGRYVFADVGTQRLFHIAADTQPTLTVTTGLNTGLSITSFGEANDGELYAVDYGGGGLYQVTGTSTGGSGVATQLSATGCVNAANATQPASGLIPFTPNAPFWSDGATKERWIALPNGQNITVNTNGDWDFPNGTVLVKNFRLGNQLVETRHFMRHPDGVWAGYTYEWNALQTDATLVTGGKQVMVGGQPWIFPSEAQCLQCHTSAAGRSLGLENLQLAHEITYPQTGRTAHQLVTLNAINVLSPQVANPTSLTPYPNPQGSAGTLAERARSYLHSNCSGCHRQGGPTPSNMDLRFSMTLAGTNACDVTPTLGDLGIANARLIAPGSAARSVLIARMSRRDANGMPPVGSAQVDNAGATLLANWVNSLANCN